MASKTIIDLLCDVCLHEGGRETKGETVTLKINAKPAVAMELCEPHRKKLLGPLTAALDEIKPRHADGRRRRVAAKKA